ncbi:MAG: glycosyltransferase [Arachnia sp.]
MRVALVLDDFYPSSGGIARSVETQLEKLVEMGHEVTLIAPDRHLQKPRGCRTIECPTFHVRGTSSHLNVLHFSERRARLISDCAEFDVIHSQTERGALILGARVARLQGIPHVHTFHANMAGTHQTVRRAIWGTLTYQFLINPVLTSAARRRSPRSRLPRRERESGGLAARMDWASFADLAGKVDAHTVPSPFMRELIGEAAGSPLHGFVVPTGYNDRLKRAIDESSRTRSDDWVRFLSVGRLAKEKRLDVLIRAFLEADLPNAELVIIGDGDQRKALRDLADGDPRIDFRGHLSSLESIAAELRNADVLVLSSYRFDSQALVIVEAVAAGLPVMYCDDRLTVGVSAETSHLTGPDIVSMSQGIRDMCDPATRHRLAAAAPALLPSLSADRMAERFVLVYESVIQGSCSG